MGARNLHIYNESYPLPEPIYSQAKEEKNKCSGEKQCELKLKYNIETFIADYAKKVGTKIENDESRFLEVGTGFGVKGKVDWVKLTLIVAVVVLTIYAIMRKNVAVGAVAMVGGIFLFASPKFLSAKKAKA